MKLEPAQLPGLDTPARQAEAAMKRLREFINRSAAQHLSIMQRRWAYEKWKRGP